MLDERLAINVTHADGSTTRWGYDEVDGRRIPNDLTFSTKIPGGFDTMSCSLFRRLDQQYADQDLFDTVTVYGPGGRVAYEGRMQQFPRSHGDTYSITPGAVGWAAHLRDSESFREVYIDRDLSHWQPATLTRRQGGAVTHDFLDARVVQETLLGGAPALNIGMVGAWNRYNVCEAYYYCPPGIVTGRLKTDWQINTTNINVADGNWIAEVWTVGEDGSAGFVKVVPDFMTAASGSIDVSPAVPDRTWMIRQGYTTGPAGGGNRTYDLFLSGLRVFGGHGLTPIGTGTLGEGFAASDIIKNVVARGAPLLTTNGVETTTFPIPHATYLDITTPEFVVSDVNKYHLNDWGVYENKDLFYRSPTPDRLTWEARLGDGAHMDADGLTGEQVLTGVIVKFTDGADHERTVGPAGYTTVDWTYTGLGDTSTTNPANAHGIAKVNVLELSFPSTQDGAAQIGATYFAERATAIRRGSLTLTGGIRHPQEGLVPVWRVRAGDWIKVTDLDGSNASVPRKIISTTYTHATASITLELDNTASKLDAIMARVGVQTGIQLGSGF